jgi:hypothetical protein
MDGLVVESFDGTLVATFILPPGASRSDPVPRRRGCGAGQSRRRSRSTASRGLEPGHSLELEATTGSTQYGFGRMGPFAIEFEATPTIPIAPARFAAPVRRAK